MTSDLSPEAQLSYQAGIAPLDFAEARVMAIIRAHRNDISRVDGPAARHILGALLDAGWSMPVWPVPEPAQETS